MKPHRCVPNPYLTLGIPSDATADQVRRAYRSLALKHHPDSNPEDPSAEERFKEIQHAYEVLFVFLAQTNRESKLSVHDREIARILERLKSRLSSPGSTREGFRIEISLGKSCSKSLFERTKYHAQRLSPTSGFVRPIPPQPPKAPRKPR